MAVEARGCGEWLWRQIYMQEVLSVDAKGCGEWLWRQEGVVNGCGGKRVW